MSEKTLQREQELAPQLPAQVPAHLFHVVAALDEGIKLDAPATAARALRESLAFLLGYFADVVGAACIHFGASRELFAREDASINLAESEKCLREGLHFLTNRMDKEPLAKALVGVFFDLGAQEPREFYALTQGKVGSVARLSDACKSGSKLSRKESLKFRTNYLPQLAAWLRAARPFWESSKLLWEHTSIQGQQQVALEHSGVSLTVGARCDLFGCPACIPTRTLQVPAALAGEEYRLGVPQGVPSHTLHLVDRLDQELQDDQAIGATRLLRDTLEFLLRYFAGVAVTLTREMEIFPPEARKYTENYELVDNCERLLHLGVERLKECPEDPGAKLLVGVFYRRNESLEYVPRAHTRVLLLEDVLSSWFKTERGGVTPTEEKSRKDFERFFPLLRDWLTAMGTYFSQVEHYEEPPGKDGRLPLTLKLGDRLLELSEPHYILRIRQCPVCLPDPIWVTSPRPAPPPKPVVAEVDEEELTPAPGTATVAEKELPAVIKGEFHRLKAPTRSPRFLERILKRLDIHLQRDEMAGTWLALRDALDYLVRYWAGVSSSAARHLRIMSDDHADLAETSTSVEQCEKLLIAMLEVLLEKPDEDLTQEIRPVFFERNAYSEQDVPQGSHAAMIAMDADPGNKMQLLSEFCAREPQKDLHKCRREVKTFLPLLRDWLARSERFFEQCEHHEEAPDPYDGRMELVVQFDQTYLELVAPDYVFCVRPDSDVVPELPVPEYHEPEEAVHVEEVKEARPLTEEEKALQEPFLLHRVAYIGTQKNSSGAPCKSGIIHIKNAGGGSLSGTAFTTHPCLEVSPRRFKDNSQLTYWLDESQVPRDYSPVIMLRSGSDERQVTLNELRPLSMLSTINEKQARFLLAAPTLAVLLLFACLLWVVGSEVGHMLEPYKNMKLADTVPAELDTALQKGQMIGWMFLLLPLVAPAASWRIYQKLPPTLQDMCLGDLRRWLLMPSAIVVTLIVLPIFRTWLTSHPEIRSMNLVRLLPWFLVFNLGTAIYVHLAQTQKLNEWVEEPALRKLIPVVGLGFYFMGTTLALM